jgi:F-type H+-transporting ATPase subunit b
MIKILRSFLVVFAFLLCMIVFPPSFLSAAESQSTQSGESGHAAAEHEFSWKETAAQWFNFAVLAWLLYYFLTKKMKLTDNLRGEAAEIQSAIESARQAKEEAERKLKELDERMAGMSQEIAKIKDQAARDAETERLRILEAAQAEAKRIVDLANREIEAEVRLAKKQLLKVVGDVAVQKSKKIVEDEITEDDQKRLIEDYIGSFTKK